MTLLGVNTPTTLSGDYGHDLAPNPRFPTWPCTFDPMHAYRALIEASELGFRAVRIWLCENAEGIVVDDTGAVTGVHDQLLESLEIIQEAARLHGIKLYPCLLDGNAWAREQDAITGEILSNTAQTQRFAKHVVRPIVRALDPEVVIAVDIVNEPETCTAACMQGSELAPIPWSHLGASIRTVGDALRSERDLLVTAGHDARLPAGPVAQRCRPHRRRRPHLPRQRRAPIARGPRPVRGRRRAPRHATTVARRRAGHPQGSRPKVRNVPSTTTSTTPPASGTPRRSCGNSKVSSSTRRATVAPSRQSPTQSAAPWRRSRTRELATDGAGTRG